MKVWRVRRRAPRQQPPAGAQQDAQLARSAALAGYPASLELDRSGGRILSLVSHPAGCSSDHEARWDPATGVRPRRLDRSATSFGLVLR